MDKIKEIEKIIEEKSNELKEFSDKTALAGPLHNLSTAFNELKKIKNVTTNVGIDSANLENFMSTLAASHQDDRSRKEYTISPLVEKLPLKPYSKTTNYFGGGIGSTIQVDRGPGKPQSTVTSSDVFTTIYPGSISYRYGTYNRIRIPCGPYYEGFVSHLQGLHELSKSPIFRYEGKDVFEIKKIKGVPLDPITNRYRGSIPFCPRCLSISVVGGVNKEQCNHIRDQDESLEFTKNIPTSPILKNKENIEQRKSVDCESFSFPLNQIFENTKFLENTQILTIATGFTRQASFGRGVNTNYASVKVRYDPYIGYKTDTNGLVFKIKEIPDKFISNVINEKFLVRDIIIDIFAERIEKIINEHNRSIFELELWLSGMIKTLGLDSIDDTFNHTEILQSLDSDHFRNTFEQNIIQEITYYSHPPRNIGPEIISEFSKELSELEILNDDLNSKIRNLLKISLSYLIYMSSLITSGSTTTDLDFIFPKESNEIVIYDRVSDGNGASKLIKNYLIGDNSHISQEQGLRPKYFQETLLELLQPCSQGVADRIFFQKLKDIFLEFTKNDLITYRLDELSDQNDSSLKEFNHIIESGIENMVPMSIGKRPLVQSDGSDDGIENKKIQEIAHICVHGCPECILLNSYSGPSIPKVERFYVSKYLVDLYFNYIIENMKVRLDESLPNIEKIIKQHGMIILSHIITKADEDLTPLLKKVNFLIGEKFDGKLIKFSGIWFNCPISKSPKVEITVLMSVIK